MGLKDTVFKRLNIFSRLVPPKEGLWVFGAWTGKLFADNPKYLYEYVLENHKEIEAIWITDNESVHQEMTKEGYTCYLRYSVKGILAALRAECAFITSMEQSDISPFINREKTKVVQLWHGVGAKASRWKDEKGNPVFSSPEEIKRNSSYYWMASSEKNREVIMEETDTPYDRFYITGYPRNDVFVTKPRNVYFEQLRSKYDGCKFIIYMPTHRNFGTETVKVDEFIEVDKKLREKNWIMVYKPHVHELKNVLHLESEFTNIILAKDQKVWGDVYSYLHYFDLLISDYSSVAYDFLCTGKPIVQYTYDLDYYKKADAGLCDYFEAMPIGPFCFTWDETIQQIDSLFTQDTWQDRRELCRQIFHPYKDGNNAKRVYETVIHDVLKREEK